MNFLSQLLSPKTNANWSYGYECKCLSIYSWYTSCHTCSHTNQLLLSNVILRPTLYTVNFFFEIRSCASNTGFCWDGHIYWWMWYRPWHTLSSLAWQDLCLKMSTHLSILQTIPLTSMFRFNKHIFYKQNSSFPGWIGKKVQPITDGDGFISSSIFRY